MPGATPVTALHTSKIKCRFPISAFSGRSVPVRGGSALAASPKEVALYFCTPGSDCLFRGYVDGQRTEDGHFLFLCTLLAILFFRSAWSKFFRTIILHLLTIELSPLVWGSKRFGNNEFLEKSPHHFTKCISPRLMRDLEQLTVNTRLTNHARLLKRAIYCQKHNKFNYMSKLYGVFSD